MKQTNKKPSAQEHQSPEKQEEKKLSTQEIQVLYFLCRDFISKEIADKMNVSPRTIEKHRENLHLKTNTKTSAGLAVYALKNGIVEV